MKFSDQIVAFIAHYSPFSWWIIGLLLSGLAAGLYRGISNGFFRAHKIQPNGFRWAIFRKEMLFAALSITVSATVLSLLTKYLVDQGIITTIKEPAAWWVIGLEYLLAFFAFDTYFYWLHRFMHKEPYYTWIHKIHHYSTSPNLLTTLSVSPIESIINGGFVPLFTMLFTVHDTTMLLLTPTNLVMGFYVHTGYEFFPRWWNRSWATKWFITTTFHDHHHKYFRFNFGGYTTIWDWLCGTVRPKFVEDFEAIKARAARSKAAPATGAVASEGTG